MRGMVANIAAVLHASPEWGERQPYAKLKIYNDLAEARGTVS